MNKTQKIINFILIIAILAIAFLLLEKKQHRIAVVNNDKVIANFNDVKIAKSKIDQKKTELSHYVDTLQKELKTSIEEYKSDSATLSKNKKSKSILIIREKQKQYIQYSEALKQKVKQEEEKQSLVIFNRIKEYVSKYGKENGFDLIVSESTTGNVLFAGETIDITDEIIKGLNMDNIKKTK